MAISPSSAAIDLLDKKTLATIRRIRCGQAVPIDLAIHPTQPISYVAVRTGRAGANPSFLIVDEKNGSVRGSREYFGAVASKSTPPASDW